MTTTPTEAPVTAEAPMTAEAPTRPRRTPRVTTRATDEGLEIRFELPGATSETIELAVEDGELRLAATTRLETPERAALLEFRPTDFGGRWTLPDDITAEGATTSLDHGILTLTLPRRAPSRHESESG